jgi:hypothetical protein
VRGFERRGAGTAGCRDWTWHNLDFDPTWAAQCYAHRSFSWAPTPQVKVTSGRGPYVDAGSYAFGRGGNQGGEGSDDAEEFWIDNGTPVLRSVHCRWRASEGTAGCTHAVLEELDAPNEFFYDAKARLLCAACRAHGTRLLCEYLLCEYVNPLRYFIPNGTAPPDEFVVPTLANLIEVVGSQAPSRPPALPLSR